jgi:hypothetical protein
MVDIEWSHLTVHYRSIKGVVYLWFPTSKDADVIHLQHIWNPYIQVMAFGLIKKNSHIITPRGMLEPWIMAHNPEEKIALFYTRKAIQRRAAYSRKQPQMEADNIAELIFKLISIILTD